jgi:hypothetical protein
VVRPIGFNHEIALALIPAMAAREVAVVLAGDDVRGRRRRRRGRAGPEPKLKAGWTLPTALAFLAWFVFAPQCLSTIAVARRETNGWKWPMFMLAYLFGLAYVFAGLTYWLASRRGALAPLSCKTAVCPAGVTAARVLHLRRNHLSAGARRGLQSSERIFMAGSVNKVILIGNLGQDPEVKSFQNGGRIANLRIATSENWKDKNTGERKERTEWHTVVLQSDGLVGVAERICARAARSTSKARCARASGRTSRATTATRPRSRSASAA